MSNLVDVIIPSIGESITVAYIAEIFVQPGQAISGVREPGTLIEIQCTT